MSETAIQQLWYTWSEFGYGSLHTGGYRDRAASDRLSNDDGRRKKLDQYAGYELPRGTDKYDAVLEQGKAPVSLAFLRIPSAQTSQDKVKQASQDEVEQYEYILVHSVYAGKDARNRPGVFFSHILADLPDTFSAKDALALWRANFWQTTNPSQYEYGLVIQSIPSEQLKRYHWPLTDAAPLTLDSDNDHVRFLVHACLLQQIEQERIQGNLAMLADDLENLERQIASDSTPNKTRKDLNKIYNEKKAQREQIQRNLAEIPRISFAIEPDELVLLIARLIEILEPFAPQLCKALTFSTYEYDVFRNKCHIVGTCLPPSSSPVDSRREILPALCYTSGFAFNCYTGKHTPLEHWSSPDDQELAYLAMLVDFLLRPSELLTTLQAEARSRKISTVQQLLALFYDYIVVPGSIDQPKCVQLFASFDSAKLGNPVVREKIFGFIGQDARYQDGWFQRELQPAVRAFVAKRNQMQGVEVIIQDFAKSAVKHMYDDVAHQSNYGGFDAIYPGFSALYDFLRDLAPLTRSSPYWIDLVQRLFGDPKCRDFILANWELRRKLLFVAASVLSEPDQYVLLVQPLLVIRPGEEATFATLLDLKLPASWNALLIRSINQYSQLNPATVQALVPYHQALVALIEQQSESYNSADHQEIETLYRKIITSQYLYPQRWELLLAWHNLLSKKLDAGPQLKRIIYDNMLFLTAENIRNLLHDYKELYKRIDESILLDLYGRISIDNTFDPTAVALDVLGGKPVQRDTLRALLQTFRSSKDNTAIERLFLEHGRTYIEAYPQARTLQYLFTRWIETDPLDKLTILGYWLTAWLPLEPELDAPAFINRACQTYPERRQVLSGYGSMYLKKEPEHELAGTFIQMFQAINKDSGRLAYADDLLPTLFIACHSDELRERLLAGVHLISQQQAGLIEQCGYMPFFYRSDIGRQMYQQAVRLGTISPERKMRILSAWMETETLQPGDFDTVDALSSPNLYEQCQIVNQFGVSCLTRYPIIPNILQRYFRTYLQQFDAASLLPGNSQWQTNNMQETQILLNAVASSDKLPQDITLLANGWLLLAEFFRQCIGQEEQLRDDKVDLLGKALYTLLTASPIAPEHRSRLWQALASVLVHKMKSDTALWVFLTMTNDYISISDVADRNDLLCEMGRQAGRNSWEQGDIRYLLPYIRVLPCLDLYFKNTAPAMQPELTFKVWGILLPEGSERAMDEIDAYIQSAKGLADWNRRISEAWHQYELKYKRVPGPVAAPIQVAQMETIPSPQQNAPVYASPLVASVSPQQPQPPVQPPPNQAGRNLPVPVAQQATNSGARTQQVRVFPWKGIISLFVLRWWVLRHKGTGRIMRWWQRHQFLADYPEMIGEKDWTKLALALSFQSVYKLTQLPNSDLKAMKGLIDIRNDIHNRFGNSALLDTKEKAHVRKVEKKLQSNNQNRGGYN